MKLSLDQLKSLNLSKNKFTSNGIRKLFEQKFMVKKRSLLKFNIKFYCFRII